MVTVLVKVVQPERSVLARAARGESARRERVVSLAEDGIFGMMISATK